MIRVVVFLLALLSASPVFAVDPDEMLKDVQLETRARDISGNLRCLVCQNQSIDDSNAGLAKDLRLIVRERLTAGDSDAQVYDYVVARYGNFVLLKPPFQADTLVLWLAPFAMLGLALVGFVLFIRKSNRQADDIERPLADDERQRLSELEKMIP
jgi:cytochrome c-type biogenesis protein CcmH